MLSRKPIRMLPLVINCAVLKKQFAGGGTWTYIQYLYFETKHSHANILREISDSPNCWYIGTYFGERSHCRVSGHVAMTKRLMAKDTVSVSMGNHLGRGCHNGEYYSERGEWGILLLQWRFASMWAWDGQKDSTVWHCPHFLPLSGILFEAILCCGNVGWGK